MFLIKNGSPIKRYLLTSWLIPAVVAILISVVVFITLGKISHNSLIDSKIDELTNKSNTIARRVSAELILGESGAPKIISKKLEKELSINSISIADSIPCQIDKTGICHAKSGGVLTVFRKIPFLEANRYVANSISLPPLTSSLNFELVLWAVFPILLFLTMGVLLQKFFLQKYIIYPIQSLVETTVDSKSTPSHWPKEIQEISNNLKQTYDERDQVVFGQLARGVIHDIKMRLQSLVSATALVEEVDDSSTKRAKRLEMLFGSCKAHLNKILRVIEETLDGSREIPIKPQMLSLNETIADSISANHDLATSRAVEIISNIEPDSLIAAHDPTQLERVLTNLIKNGIESFDEDPHKKKKKIVRVNTVQENGHIKISIDDSGPGLKTKENIFKSLKSTKVHGTGLGLFISKKIVEGHKGTIQADQSKDLKGASFTIVLNRGNNAIQ